MLLALGLGCAGETSATEGDLDRRPLSKADAAGSCLVDDAPACGGQSAGLCWCDTDCHKFGDCCGDAAALCEADTGGVPDSDTCAPALVSGQAFELSRSENLQPEPLDCGFCPNSAPVLRRSFAYTPAEDGVYRLDTLGTGLDSVIAVHELAEDCAGEMIACMDSGNLWHGQFGETILDLPLRVDRSYLVDIEYCAEGETAESVATQLNVNRVGDESLSADLCGLFESFETGVVAPELEAGEATSDLSAPRFVAHEDEFACGPAGDYQVMEIDLKEGDRLELFMDTLPPPAALDPFNPLSPVDDPSLRSNDSQFLAFVVDSDGHIGSVDGGTDCSVTGSPHDCPRGAVTARRDGTHELVFARFPKERHVEDQCVLLGYQVQLAVNGQPGVVRPGDVEGVPVCFPLHAFDEQF